MTDEIDLDEALREARERVWEAIIAHDCNCGRSNHLDYCPMVDQEPAVDAALDRYERLAKAVGAASIYCGAPRVRYINDERRIENCGTCMSCKAKAEAQRIAQEMAIPGT